MDEESVDELRMNAMELRNARISFAAPRWNREPSRRIEDRVGDDYPQQRHEPHAERTKPTSATHARSGCASESKSGEEKEKERRVLIAHCVCLCRRHPQFAPSKMQALRDDADGVLEDVLSAAPWAVLSQLHRLILSKVGELAPAALQRGDDDQRGAAQLLSREFASAMRGFGGDCARPVSPPPPQLESEREHEHYEQLDSSSSTALSLDTASSLNSLSHSLAKGRAADAARLDADAPLKRCLELGADADAKSECGGAHRLCRRQLRRRVLGAKVDAFELSAFCDGALSLWHGQAQAQVAAEATHARWQRHVTATHRAAVREERARSDRERRRRKKLSKAQSLSLAVRITAAMHKKGAAQTAQAITEKFRFVSMHHSCSCVLPI